MASGSAIVDPISGGSCRSGESAEQLRQADEIVGSDCQSELESQLLGSAYADGFAPAKRLFRSLAFLLADRLARMPRREAVNRRGPVGRALRDMRCYVEVAQIVNERACIVGLVGTERDAPSGNAGA